MATRLALAGRTIDILPPADEDKSAATNPGPASAGQDDSVEVLGEDQSPTPHAPEADTARPEHPAADTAASALMQATEQPVLPVPQQAQGQPVPAAPDVTASTPVPAKRRPNTSAAPKEKKISALDAPARVLAESGQPMTLQELIGAMAQSGSGPRPAARRRRRPFIRLSPTRSP